MALHIWQSVTIFLAHCWAFFPPSFFSVFCTFLLLFFISVCSFSGQFGRPEFLLLWDCTAVFLLFTTVPVVDHEGSQDLIVCCSDQLLVVSAAPCEKWSPSCLLCRGRHYKHPVQHQVFTGDVTDTNLNNFQLLRVNECTDGERQEDWGRWLYVRKMCNCRHITIKDQVCYREIKTFCLRPYYLPREFSHDCDHELRVYPHLNANADAAQS